MFSTTQLEKMRWIDIETVPEYPGYNSLPESFKAPFAKKYRKRIDEGESVRDIYKDMGLSSEFGRIVCISIAKWNSSSSEGGMLVTKSYASANEPELLKAFYQEYQDAHRHNIVLVAHNGKSFDFPFICRRMVKWGIKIPEILQTFGKKPWEITGMIDTMDIWKFGDWGGRASLDALAAMLGIPSSKSDIDGSQVGEVFWETGDINRIAEYCERDTVVTARICFKLAGMAMPEYDDM